jgi:cellulose biosynthesis protein BcsQ
MVKLWFSPTMPIVQFLAFNALFIPVQCKRIFETGMKSRTFIHEKRRKQVARTNIASIYNTMLKTIHGSSPDLA